MRKETKLAVLKDLEEGEALAQRAVADLNAGSHKEAGAIALVSMAVSHRGFRIEVTKYGAFEAQVGSETCRAESMDGMRRSIDAELTLRDADPVSIPVVMFDGGHVLREGRPEVVNWHSVDYNVHSFKGTHPDTGEKVDGYDRVFPADTEIGRQVIELKRTLRSAYQKYQALNEQYEALESEHGLRPPDSLGTTWDIDRLAAQAWMVDRLLDAGGIE